MKLRNDDLAISRWGEEQSIEESRIGEYNVLLKEIERYMLEEVNVEDKYKKIKKQCQNRYPDCTFWALEGEVSLDQLMNLWTGCFFNVFSCITLLNFGFLSLHVTELPHLVRSQP
mgnify:CR=1 FL=1